MLNISKIDCAKHIVISLPEEADVALIASANALYSYILTLHKKVSFYSEKFEKQAVLNFLPWMDKLKDSYPASADLEIKLQSVDEVFSFFQDNEIKLNQKMATSLYASLIANTQGFSKGIDGMVFAFANEMLKSGADVNICNKYILNFNTLAALRLKAILLNKMILTQSAETALFELDDSDLKSSGASLKDARVVLKDALSLPTVNRVIVKYKNEEIINEGDMV